MDTTKSQKPLSVSRKFGKFEIRETTAADNDLVRSLILEVRKEIDAHSQYLLDPELDNIHGYYSGEESVFMVLTVNCKVIGTVGILPLPKTKKDGCELKKFYLERKWRGFGLGMELIKSCLHKAQEMGYGTCYLETDPLLQRAGSLYKRLGFKNVPQNEYILMPPTRYNWHFKPLQESFQKHNDKQQG
nr:GNAT family N-acetyltransferase [Allomuricauda sp.]